MSQIRDRQSVDSVSGSINAMLSVLDGVTPLDVERTTNGISATLNPFQFVMSLLQRVAGYDRVVTFITELAVNGLPMFEDSLKIALIEALKDLFSCSVNPILSKDIINQGVILDLSSIDLLNIMNRCPLGNENKVFKTNGSFFYFDVDRFTIPDQLERCKDLNAVIWYVKHRADDRTVWYGYEHQDEEHEILTVANPENNIPGSLPSAKDGVITLEYSEDMSKLKDCQNQHRVMSPSVINNCLHVFLGNTKGIPTTGEDTSSDDIVSKTEDFMNVLDSLTEKLKGLEAELESATKIDEKADLQCQVDLVNKIIDAIKNGKKISEAAPGLPVEQDTGKHYVTVGDSVIRMSDYTYNHTKSDLAGLNKALKIRRKQVAEHYVYRTPEDNYYYHKSLFEFNTDYVMSVKFFDSKTLADQIMDIMTGCFGISLNISFEERLIRNEVEKMLAKVIENTETVTISDCFFTFSNDDYNMLVDETEKERIGRYTKDDYAYGSVIDYDKIYEELNKVSSSATLSEQVTNITRAFNEVSRSIKPEMYDETDEFALNFSFLNNLLRSLTLSMVYNIISPKIYLLMAINLKIMGKEPNFNVQSFLEMFKTLIISLVRSIADKIMEQMTEWLLSLVKDLVARLGDRLLLEQAGYYMRLLMSCMRAFRLMWGSEEWNMADVEYADIVSDYNETCATGSMSNTIENTKC